VGDLAAWLAKPASAIGEIGREPFPSVPLTKGDAGRSAKLLWDHHAATLRGTRAAEMKAQAIELDGLRMKFETVIFGPKDEPPEGGRSLFISMHGGGGAPPAVNESQWRNQIKLGAAYRPAEGIYLAPRAPTDTWNLWHEAHIDIFFDRIIQNLIALENVNPNRVYLLGYSAGGDGAYQLGPRMADRYAAVAMMGGHPNEASPLGLRNIGFAIQVGANDGAYNRNKVAAEWGRKLDDLRKADPAGYAHFTEIHAGKGHWMDLEDRKAIPWMEKFTRNALPKKIVWRQDDVIHTEFYWLAVPKEDARAGQEIVAELDGQHLRITATGVPTVTIRLNDRMLDLDKPVTIEAGGGTVRHDRVPRTIATQARTLGERGDPDLVFGAEVTVHIPAK
jgi:dienelactone hydrolase